MITIIDQISTPPTPADTPADFEQKASQVWADLFKAVPQMNAQAVEIAAIGQAAVAAGQSAQADSDAALGYRNEARAARDAALGYQTGASGYSAAAGVARTGAESAASDADAAAGRAETAAAEAESTLANAVQRTAATGAAMLPEGTDAQRPATGSIPAGSLLVRGSTQTPDDYKPEFWDRAVAVWKVIADRSWVQAITNALSGRISALEARPKCRAWANINGTGSVTLRGASNVSSVTWVSAGTYRVNFATPMPDTGYAVLVSGEPSGGVGNKYFGYPDTAARATVLVYNSSGALADSSIIGVAVFG